MDEVKCYRCGRKMRKILRLGVYFCDNDGYIMSFTDAASNNLVDFDSSPSPAHH